VLFKLPDHASGRPWQLLLSSDRALKHRIGALYVASTFFVFFLFFFLFFFFCFLFFVFFVLFVCLFVFFFFFVFLYFIYIFFNFLPPFLAFLIYHVGEEFNLKDHSMAIFQLHVHVQRVTRRMSRATLSPRKSFVTESSLDSPDPVHIRIPGAEAGHVGSPDVQPPKRLEVPKGK
jgi:hypothetical protein